jgi:hypothetical protein
MTEKQMSQILEARRFDMNNKFEPPVKTIIKNRKVSLIRAERPDLVYEFELKRIQTAQSLLSWTHHLCRKGWMDMHSLKVLIETVAEHNRISLAEH